MLKAKKIQLVCILALFVLVLSDAGIIGMHCRDYQQKLNLAGIILNQDSDLGTVTAILRGDADLTESATKGRESLKQLGYLNGVWDSNIFIKERNYNIVLTIIFSIVIYGVLLVSLIVMKVEENKKYNSELEQLSTSLDQLAKNLYNADSFAVLGTKNMVIRQIYEQIQSISDVMRLNYERMTREKEETKSIVTDISHQLKTPVAALRACFDVLKEKNLSEEEREEFTLRCIDQLDGLEALLKSLLSISRLEAGMVTIQLKPEVLFETIAMAVSRVYPFADSRQISIEMEASDEIQSMVIPHDRNWFAEAMINLLENAIKYSPSESVIKIRMSRRLSFLRIELEDEGIGIPKSEYHKVFQRFYRGASKEVQSQRGSGVGLYLTREIINRHQGGISVSSKWDSSQKKCSGTIFIIQVPYLTKM